MCSSFHIGPVYDVRVGVALCEATGEGSEIVTQVCASCKRAMTALERQRYWRLHRRVLWLKIEALRATIEKY